MMSTEILVILGLALAAGVGYFLYKTFGDDRPKKGGGGGTGTGRNRRKN